MTFKWNFKLFDDLDLTVLFIFLIVNSVVPFFLSPLKSIWYFCFRMESSSEVPQVTTSGGIFSRGCKFRYRSQLILNGYMSNLI